LYPDPLTTSFPDAVPPSPSPLPDTNDTVAATALRNLSQENENLRQTVAALNRTVRNLAQQQQDDHVRLKQQEEKYREELEALREHQNRLAEHQAVRNRQMEQLKAPTANLYFAMILRLTKIVVKELSFFSGYLNIGITYLDSRQAFAVNAECA
uniref:SPAR_C domain-containing protein n=1 Tax=Echinostoma caproni TaxID=27848 RepID=A0A183AD37_9TREM